MRRLLLVVAAAVAFGSMWYAVAPPRSADSYEQRAVDSAALLRSHVQTARLWARAVREDNVTRAAASVAFEEAETDARAVADRFATFDPPDPLDTTEPLRDRLLRAASDAVEVLAQVRIAADTGQWARLDELLPRLDDMQRKLDDLQQELRR